MNKLVLLSQQYLRWWLVLLQETAAWQRDQECNKIVVGGSACWAELSCKPCFLTLKSPPVHPKHLLLYLPLNPEVTRKCVTPDATLSRWTMWSGTKEDKCWETLAEVIILYVFGAISISTWLPLLNLKGKRRVFGIRGFYSSNTSAALWSINAF